MKCYRMLTRWKRALGLIVCAAVLDLWGCTWYMPPPNPTFEIRDLVDSTSAARHLLKDDEGKEFFVGDTVFFSRADMKSVEAGRNPEFGGGSVLNITWNPESAVHWTSYTASRVGKRIAIIANGKVLATPKVLDKIEHPGIMVSMPEVSLEEAKKMAKELSPGKH